MAYFRKSDFAKMVGTTTGNLSNEAKRGKLIYSGKYVDDQHPLNKEYIKHRRELLKKKGKKIDSAVKPIPINKISKSDLQDNSPVSITKQAKLKMLKDEQDLRKKQIAADLAELEYKRMMGSSIPTDMVEQIISLMGQSFLTSFNNAVSALLDEVSHRKKLTPKERASLKGKLIEIVNDSQSNAVVQAQMNVDNVIKSLQDGKKTGRAV